MFSRRNALLHFDIAFVERQCPYVGQSYVRKFR